MKGRHLEGSSTEYSVLSAVLEGQDAMAHVPRQISEIDERLKNVESDVKVIKAVVTGHSSQLDDHEIRITTLEQA